MVVPQRDEYLLRYHGSRGTVGKEYTIRLCDVYFQAPHHPSKSARVDSLSPG